MFMSQNTSTALSTSQDTTADQPPVINNRFRGYLPVVVDVETAGFNAATDALLEIACIPIIYDADGQFCMGEAVHAYIEPFEGANLEPRALEFTGIDPHNPQRKAIAEDENPALKRIFKHLTMARRSQKCTKCILVGHNAHFDLSFLQAATQRTSTKNKTPFHAFSVLDTATLSALAFGQTVLARACQLAGIEFSGSEAHSALYDTQKTAELFCHILNSYPLLDFASPADDAADATTNVTTKITTKITTSVTK